MQSPILSSWAERDLWWWIVTKLDNSYNAERAVLNSVEIRQISPDTSEINEHEGISREIAEAWTYSSKVIWRRDSIPTITLMCSQCYALIQGGRERALLCNTREERIVRAYCSFEVKTTQILNASDVFVAR